MKIIIIGATGTIGSAVASAPDAKHEVIRASRTGSVKVDLADRSSISSLFAAVARFDALVCCADSVSLAPFDSLSEEAFQLSLSNKLFGQINIVREAIGWLRDHGSITITSGQIPAMSGSAAGALTNAGLAAFVRAVALGLPRGIRINTVARGGCKRH